MSEWTQFRAQLETSPILAGRVHPVARIDNDGKPVRTNYVVAKSARPDKLTPGRFTAVQAPWSDRRYTFDVRVVTVDDGGLDTYTNALLSVLVGQRLEVPGRDCSPIRLVEEVEEGDGHDRTAQLFYRDFSFRFWSRPTNPAG